MIEKKVFIFIQIFMTNCFGFSLLKVTINYILNFGRLLRSWSSYERKHKGYFIQINLIISSKLNAQCTKMSMKIFWVHLKKPRK